MLKLSIKVTAIYEYRRILMKWTISTVNNINKLKLCKIKSKYPQSSCGIELPGWICMEKIKGWCKWSACSLLVIKQDGVSCHQSQMNFSTGFIGMDLSSEPWTSAVLSTLNHHSQTQSKSMGTDDSYLGEKPDSVNECSSWKNNWHFSNPSNGFISYTGNIKLTSWLGRIFELV